MSSQNSRRDFLKMTTAAAAGATMPYWFTSAARSNYVAANERPVLGCIGTGSRWGAVGPQAMKFSDCAAVCDVDANHAGAGKERVQKEQGSDRMVDVYEDYRKIIERDDIDIVTIVTPDHWHTKIAIEAMQAGKDVYCEKPLTLTIEEGRQIIKALDQTKAVFQVGTQQRTEMGQRFLKAVAIIKEGRIGQLKEVTCAIGGVGASGPIPVAEVPKGLNWEMWLGQAPLVDYRFKETSGRWNASNCHYEFRWWYEYSGGKMTDWGAHHIDIAQWAIEQQDPKARLAAIEPIEAVHDVELKDGMPVQDDRYNVALQFTVKTRFNNGVILNIREKAEDLGFDNGIMFEGTEGRLFVNRGKLAGAPVEELSSNPLPEDAIEKIYGSKPTSHMENFFNCVKSRELPISDVYSHHRAMTTCHLANIAIRLDRSLNWDAENEQIVGDEQANNWQSREQRKGYEIKV
ncbi:Gfo/Idh/MocA family protein [Rubinisphaera margarita]|uniref:Gfo/Idh/MocA family protein n=1 Tax=Rubinisphaera margarita TaxID=2909586 RepID=UPI001EE9AD75|nr:Gfo/Idh/MocA family oxidoreductase [Rubinisphaera margarita]MCG6156080.1 Gfo/Idh/MocA family oxidoreductase [Rubinisphaera margarita]